MSNKPHTLLGAGRLTAAVWKSGDEQKGWQYHFNVYHMSGADGCVSQRFSPGDVFDLVCLARLLAFTLAEDGCLKADLRKELASLAAHLDDRANLETNKNRREMTPNGQAARALRGVLDYLWEDESQHFADHPANDHIYRNLVVLEAWLAGVGQPDGGRLEPLKGSQGAEGCFGVCPLCGKTDGGLEIESSTWFLCHDHGLRWEARRLPQSNGHSGQAEKGKVNWTTIRHYRVVQPCLPKKLSQS